jgi:hypothetical protein
MCPGHSGWHKCMMPIRLLKGEGGTRDGALLGPAARWGRIVPSDIVQQVLPVVPCHRDSEAPARALLPEHTTQTNPTLDLGRPSGSSVVPSFCAAGVAGQLAWEHPAEWPDSTILRRTRTGPCTDHAPLSAQ